MNTTQIISIIVGLVLVIGIGALVYYRYKNSPKETDRQAARDFLDAIKGNVINSCLEFIKSFDYTKYNSLAEIEIDLINGMIDSSKQLIAKELEKSSDILSALAIKCLTSTEIEKYVCNIVENIDLLSNIENELGDKYNTLLGEIELEDKELNEEYSDTTKYNDQEMETLPEAKEVKYSEEDLAKLNPQVDNEESYNPNDESMELISEEEKETDDIYIDASGRVHSKSTGKFIRNKKKSSKGE